jgi:hypothetical protein
VNGRSTETTSRRDQDTQRNGQPLPWRSLVVVVGPSLLVVAYAIAGTLATIASALRLRGSGSRRLPGPTSAGGALLPWAYLLLLRPWHSRWGASQEEADGPLPYDHFVPRPLAQTTRAVTIKAPPEQVWRWIVQLGVGRGGLYSYDWLENLANLDVHSADEIVAELQDLEVGDLVRLAPERMGAEAGWRVAVMEPARTLVLHQPADQDTGRPLDRGDPDLGSYYGWNWAFVLRELEDSGTRLLVRSRVDGAPRSLIRVLYVLLLEFPHFVMERGMLKGIKRRAEGGN